MFYKRINKMVVVLSVIVLFALSQSKINAQCYQVSNKDTINKITRAFLQYLNCYSDKIGYKNFRNSRKNNEDFIAYRVYDTSKYIFDAIAVNYNPPFKRILSKQVNDSSIIPLCISSNKIKFIKLEKLTKYKKLYCYFDLFPLVRYNGRIYLKVLCRSMGDGEDEIFEDIFLIFNPKLDIISVDYTEGII